MELEKKETASIMLGMDDYVSNASTVKELIIEQLFEDGDISESVFDKYMENWQVVVVKKTWYKRIFGDSKGWCFVLVKMSKPS